MEEVSKIEIEARKAFQLGLNRLASILEKKEFTDFHEEQFRQYKVDFRKVFESWMREDKKAAKEFQSCVESIPLWELLDIKNAYIGQWIRSKINDGYVLSTTGDNENDN